MTKNEIIELIHSLNDSLDIRFLENLSKVELRGYTEHLKALRMKTSAPHHRKPGLHLGARSASAV